MGYVYLLTDGNNSYKIGVTKSDIEKRIKKLQTGNSSEIYMIDYYNSEYPFFIEKTLHNRHNKDKEVGEWFSLDDSIIFNFKNECSEIEKMIEVMKDNPFFPKNLK